jgi:hypothetical protein
MTDANANNFPQVCRSSGLTCQACAAASARSLAQVCHGLRGKALGQLFTQMYPHPACAPMHAEFAAAYQTCDAPQRQPAASASSLSATSVSGPRARQAVA